MSKKLVIAVSPLTNTIFVGKILKDGLWATGKQNVTIECLDAVAQHVRNYGKPIKITDSTGKLLYKITVE